MSEEIKSDKSITHEGLLRLAGIFCNKKLADNKHKPNPLNYSFDRLEERQIDETFEMVEAYKVWAENKTEQSSTDLVYEVADRINFLMFFMAKVLGYENLIRE